MGIQAVIDMIHDLGKKPVCPFDIDGLVIKVNDIALWNTLGMTSHHPRWAISYKFPAEYARTKILGIHHSVWRTWVITPVAQVEPVNIMGVVVKNATLHNYDEVEKKDLRIWDHVFIHRAGEVIPEIIAPIIESRLGNEVVILPPTECPVCDSATHREGEKIALLCSNPHCPAREIQALEWFVSKHGVDIDGLGPKQMEYFSELGWIEDIASIYDLRDHTSELLQLEWYREKSVENLLNAIENTRTLPIEKLIASLGISGVGKRTAKLLAPLFHRVDDLLDPHFTVEELQSVKDIWPETAQSILTYFNTHQRLIQRLLERVTLIFPEQKQLSWPLVGMTFCVTGTFILSRDEIHTIIEQHGGEVRTSVSAGLSYLLAWDSAGSKREKAQSLGVIILDWDGFQKMIQKD